MWWAQATPPLEIVLTNFQIYVMKVRYLDEIEKQIGEPQILLKNEQTNLIYLP